MKTKSLIVVAGMLALMCVSHAEEAKKEKTKKGISPELLQKYDKDQDGKLSKDERAEMKKDKAANKKADNKPEKKKKKQKEEAAN